MDTGRPSLRPDSSLTTLFEIKINEILELGLTRTAVIFVCEV